jgi:hypothetical protein
MAEVSVRVTAKNEVRTGLSAALNDVKKFSTDASRSSGGGVAPSGDKLRSSLKGLGGDLAAATTPAEAFQAVATRVAGAFGKVTSVIAGFAIGKIISGQFEKVSEGVSQSTESLKRFSSSFAEAASATTIDGAVAGFKSLNGEAERTAEILSGLKNDLGASVANALLLGQPFKEMAAAADSMRSGAASALRRSLALQAKQSEDLIGVAGDPEATKALMKQQDRERQLAAADARIAGAQNPELRFQLQNAKSYLEEIFRNQDLAAQGANPNQNGSAGFTKAEKDAADLATKRAQAEAQRARDEAVGGGKMYGPGTDEASGGGWRVEAAKFAAEQAAEAEKARVAREAAITAGVESEAGKLAFAGSSGASSLQRIGGASSEFYRTGPSKMEEDMKLVSSNVKIMADILKKAGPLVLNTNPS